MNLHRNRNFISKYKRPEVKSHLVLEENSGFAICGIRAKDKHVQEVNDYLDWGYDGDADSLCDRCVNKVNKVEFKDKLKDNE